MDDIGIIRNIGGIVAEVTVKERAQDELTITAHPVERGAPITDHAFKNPATLAVQIGWSAANPDGRDLNDIYDELLAMQVNAKLLVVQTGKRLYENMLIRSIAIDTDQMTENALMLTVQLQEIILVDTLQVTMPPNANRTAPQSASGVADTGTKAATAAPNANVPAPAPANP